MPESQTLTGLHDEDRAPILPFVQNAVGANIRRMRVAAGFKTQGEFAEAIGVPQARVSDWERGRYAVPDLRTLLRIAKCFKCRLYETHVSAHKKGSIRERSMLKQLREGLGHHPLVALTREQLYEWRTDRAKEVSPASVNRELDVLSDALAKAVPKYFAVSPITGLKRLHRVAPEAVILSREDEPTLLAELDQADRALVIAALDTLMRAGDLLKLKWDQDHKTYLTVLDPKTSQPYKVPVSTRLRLELDALERDGPYVFWHRRREWTNSNSTPLWYLWKSVCERAGLKSGRGGGLTFHSLRHTGASRMLHAGVDIETVRRIGGWKNLRVLQRYLHPSNLSAAVETIGAGIIFTPALRTTKTRQKSARFRGVNGGADEHAKSDDFE